MQYVSLAFLLVSNSVVLAFHAIIIPQRMAGSIVMAVGQPIALHLSSMMMMMYPKQEFERAIECASESGLCKDDELNKLANILESFDGCLVQDDCEQEQIDRKDVAEILRADAALQLRQVYLENVNLFKERVDEAKNKEGLGPVMETMVRAIVCASQLGLCKDDELNRLADELEAYKGCLVEEDGEQEMIDRQDVVDILRMQSALQLRQVYLENANLFKERVEEFRSVGEPEPEM